MSGHHRYTEAERKFLERYVPGHSHEEIQREFMKEFGWEVSINQIKSYIKNNGLKTGRTGRFEKGSIPHNKGQKGVHAAGCEKTWFKKGNIPKRHYPVGTERVSKAGYIEVKIAEPNKWERKHRLVWESVNGRIPKGHIVIFRDNDKTNTDIGNLMLVSRGTHAVMNHAGLCGYTGDLKDTAVTMAELSSAIAQKKKRGV